MLHWETIGIGVGQVIWLASPQPARRSRSRDAPSGRLLPEGDHARPRHNRQTPAQPGGAAAPRTLRVPKRPLPYHYDQIDPLRAMCVPPRQAPLCERVCHSEHMRMLGPRPCSARRVRLSIFLTACSASLDSLSHETSGHRPISRPRCAHACGG